MYLYFIDFASRITAETVHSAVFGLVLFPNSEESLTITAEAT